MKLPRALTARVAALESRRSVAERPPMEITVRFVEPDPEAGPGAVVDSFTVSIGAGRQVPA